MTPFCRTTKMRPMSPGGAVTKIGPPVRPHATVTRARSLLSVSETPLHTPCARTAVTAAIATMPMRRTNGSFPCARRVPSLRASRVSERAYGRTTGARLLPPGIESGDDVREHLAWVGAHRVAAGPAGEGTRSDAVEQLTRIEAAVGDDGAVHPIGRDRLPARYEEVLPRPVSGLLETERGGASRPGDFHVAERGDDRVHEAVAVGDVQL